MGKQHSGSAESFYLYRIKSKLRRFAVVALVMSAFGLMLLGKADTILVEKAQILFNDVATPVLSLLSKPAEMASRFFQNLRELASIRGETLPFSMSCFNPTKAIRDCANELPVSAMTRDVMDTAAGGGT